MSMIAATKITNGFITWHPNERADKNTVKRHETI
jgi:hypothetical protein